MTSPGQPRRSPKDDEDDDDVDVVVMRESDIEKITTLYPEFLLGKE